MVWRGGVSLLPLLAALGAGGTSPCPVRLLDIVPSEGAGEGAGGALEGLQLVESGLEYLVQQRAPLFVVPALGVYRGGKSLLLNRLMGLRAPYAGGFGVGHGQQTYTRGVYICAQEHDSLGTIIWMDTEGLFSSEDARSAYGPKIFSLALLFSSTVLLNNVKVLNEQFFTFFSDQQQIARVLKQGLTSAGLPSEALLPGNLSVFWVLQQPIHFDSDGKATRAQLDSFLGLPGDESRARVSRDYRHHVHEVPIATHDARLWGQLDSLPDEELLPEYVAASESLRALILSQLSGARPLQPAGIAAQLRMYVELVQTERFSGALAKEAFEESEIGTLCDHFSRAATALAGPLPSLTLQSAFEEALQDLEGQRKATVEAFHLGSDWSKRLDRCLRAKQDEMRQKNAEEVLVRWQAAARGVAEEGGCFFLGRLTVLLKEYVATYGQAFSHAVQKQAVDYASALQRTRLVECVRLRDFLVPLAPWLAWPVCGFYLRDSLVSGLLSLALHTIVLAGLYAVLQLLRQLPPCLDIDYPVLRAHPLLLDLVMRAPPMAPWAAMARALACVGAARSLWKLGRCLLYLGRPAGQGHFVGQMVNLELKLNALLKRSEAMFKQELVVAALDASERLESGDARAAARALVRVLCLAREVSGDWTWGAPADARLSRRSRALLQHLQLPPPGARAAAGQGQDLEGLAARGDWDGLLNHAVGLLERLTAEQAPAAGGGRGLAQQTPSPRQRRRAGYEASPVPTASPATLADVSTEIGSDGYQASSAGEADVRSPHEAVAEARTIFEGDELEEQEQGEEVEDDGGGDAGTGEGEDLEEVEDSDWRRALVGVLAAFGGCGAVAALLAAAAAAGLMPAPAG